MDRVSGFCHPTRRRTGNSMRLSSQVSFLALAFLAGEGRAAFAQAQPASADGFKVSSSVRVRYETIDGQPRAGFNSDDDLLNLRTRVAAEYNAGAFRVGGEIYDSRAYLQNSGTPVTTNEVNALELVHCLTIMPSAFLRVRTTGRQFRWRLFAVQRVSAKYRPSQGHRVASAQTTDATRHGCWRPRTRVSSE